MLFTHVHQVPGSPAAFGSAERGAKDHRHQILVHLATEERAAELGPVTLNSASIQSPAPPPPSSPVRRWTDDHDETR